MVSSDFHSLAVCGGSPHFSEPLHVGRPNLPERQKVFSRLEGVFDRNWLTNSGPLVREFEERIAARLDVKHCVATCNGTAALEIAVRALEITGEVIIPSFTFVATAHALQWQGITPVFCDIDNESHTIDPERVEEAVGPRTGGIIGVHTWGHACRVADLEDLARRHNLTLLFDAAHALGCSVGKRPIGSFGSAEILSFHATKILNTFEGGAVVTNDTSLAERIRLMKNFGFTGFDRVAAIGVNGKMSEASAAMGLSGLECLDEFIRHNENNYRVYQRELSGIPGLQLVQRPDAGRHNYHYVVTEIDERYCTPKTSWPGGTFFREFIAWLPMTGCTRDPSRGWRILKLLSGVCWFSQRGEASTPITFEKLQLFSGPYSITGRNSHQSWVARPEDIQRSPDSNPHPAVY